MVSYMCMTSAGCAFQMSCPIPRCSVYLAFVFLIPTQAKRNLSSRSGIRGIRSAM